jgi:hypothetical protein
MQRSPSKAKISQLFKNLLALWNPKFRYRNQNSPTLVRIRNLMNAVPNRPFYFHFISYSYVRRGVPSDVFYQLYRPTFYAIFLSLQYRHIRR